MAITFSTVILVIFGFVIFRKSIARITEVAPEITSIAVENIHRTAVAADEHIALAALSSHFEAMDNAAEMAAEAGVAFDGDIINLYESQVKAHDYSRRAKRRNANAPAPKNP